MNLFMFEQREPEKENSNWQLDHNPTEEEESCRRTGKFRASSADMWRSLVPRSPSEQDRIVLGFCRNSLAILGSCSSSTSGCGCNGHKNCFNTRPCRRPRRRLYVVVMQATRILFGLPLHWLGGRHGYLQCLRHYPLLRNDTKQQQHHQPQPPQQDKIRTTSTTLLSVHKKQTTRRLLERRPVALQKQPFVQG